MVDHFSQGPRLRTDPAWPEAWRTGRLTLIIGKSGICPGRLTLILRESGICPGRLTLIPNSQGIWDLPGTTHPNSQEIYATCHGLPSCPGWPRSAHAGLGLARLADHHFAAGKPFFPTPTPTLQLEKHFSRDRDHAQTIFRR